MKKLNSKNRHFILCEVSVLFCLITIFFSSCKSISSGNTITAVDLLDNKSGLYVAVPKSVDVELLKKVVKDNTSGISDKDINSILDRVNKLYIGINKTKRETIVQMSIDGNIPKQIIPKILNKKNGWNSENFIPENSVEKYPIYNQKDIALSFPSTGIACFGRDIKNMLSTYDFYKKLPEQDQRLYNDNAINDDIYEFLKGAETEIRFYANKPQTFLTMLTGTNLDLKLLDVMGSFVKDSENSNQYILNFSFQFKNEKYLKAGKALLKLAFGLTSSELENPEPTILNINNIHIDKEQVYKLLTI